MYKIGQILPTLFQTIGIEDAVKLRFLQKKWEVLVEVPVNKHTWPKNLQDGVLYVTVNSHIWLSELKLLKDDFLKKLKSFGITDVEFSYGRIYKKDIKNTRDKTFSDLPEYQKKWISELTKNIKDEEIKKITEGAVTKSISYLNSKIQKIKNS